MRRPPRRSDAAFLARSRAARARAVGRIARSSAALDRAAAAVDRAEQRLERSRRTLGRRRSALEQGEIDRETRQAARSLDEVGDHRESPGPDGQAASVRR